MPGLYTKNKSHLRDGKGNFLICFFTGASATKNWEMSRYGLPLEFLSKGQEIGLKGS